MAVNVIFFIQQKENYLAVIDREDRRLAFVTIQEWKKDLRELFYPNKKKN